MHIWPISPLATTPQNLQIVNRHFTSQSCHIHSHSNMLELKTAVLIKTLWCLRITLLNTSHNKQII